MVHGAISLFIFHIELMEEKTMQAWGEFTEQIVLQKVFYPK